MDINLTLSTREDQVTELIAWGASSKQVADKLFISKDTVVNHRRNIFQKLGIHSIGQLCAWFFCKRFKIPTSLNPIPMIAIFFLSLAAGDTRAKATKTRPSAFASKQIQNTGAV